MSVCVWVRGRGEGKGGGREGHRWRVPLLSGAALLLPHQCSCAACLPACRGLDWDALAQRKIKAPYVPKVCVSECVCALHCHAAMPGAACR